MGHKSHFRVVARMDTPRITTGVVTIDRGAGLFIVRPHRRRRTFELPLSAVADMVVARVVRTEVLMRKLDGKKKRS